MQKYSVSLNNFLHILRRGAFDETKPVFLMSGFKWAKLVTLAHKHGLTPVFAKGLQNYYYDDNLNIPPEQIEHIRELLKTSPSPSFTELYDVAHIHLQSRKNNKILQQIISREYADPEKSYETLQLLAIIVVNVGLILTGKSYLKGIIDLGRYLRSEGGKVDFVKTENWLSKTGLTRMANYQGSLLVEAFGFTIDELPFMTRMTGNAHQAVLNAVSLDDQKRLRPWDFHESKGGFVVSSPIKAVHSIRYTLGFQRYAPREVCATIYHGFVRELSEIEE